MAEGESGPSARQPFDNYPTPIAAALSIMGRVAEMVGPKRFIVEPSAGDGSFVRAARAVYPDASITAVDIRPVVREGCIAAGANGFYGEDWSEHLKIEGGFMQGVLIAGNPPFRSEGGTNVEGDLATKFILATLELMPEGSHLAFLLNLRMHAGLDRASRLWSRRDLLAWFPLAQRPKFFKNANDNNDYGVFLWQRGFRGDARTMPPLIWKEPRSLAKSKG